MSGDWDKCTNIEALRKEIRRLELIAAEYSGYRNGVTASEANVDRSLYDAIFGKRGTF